MFTEHFNFSAQPFQLTPDHRFLFESDEHSRALAHLKYGLQQSEGFIVVTGEVGAGKTTIIGHLRESLDRHKYVSTTIVSTNLKSAEILRMISAGLNLSPNAQDKASIILEIENFLHDCVRRNKRCLIFVDEAQNLSMDALEELRMLSNIHVSGIAPVQLFLLGQPQFRTTLSSPDLQQLRQRVIASYHLGPLNDKDTKRYILHRLQRVGWQDRPSFTDSSFELIYKYTEGVPRRINTLCSRILLYCYLEDLNAIDSDVIETVAQDLEQEFAQVLDTNSPPPVHSEPEAVQTAPPVQPPQPVPAPQPITSAPSNNLAVAQPVPVEAAPMSQAEPQLYTTLSPEPAGLETSGLTAEGAIQRWKHVIDLIESTPVEVFAQLGQSNHEKASVFQQNSTLAGVDKKGGSDTRTFKKLLLLILDEYLKGRPNLNHR